MKPFPKMKTDWGDALEPDRRKVLRCARDAAIRRGDDAFAERCARKLRRLEGEAKR